MSPALLAKNGPLASLALLAFLAGAQPARAAGPVPPLDEMIFIMDAAPAPIEAELAPWPSTPHFSRAIPATIHQFWNGSRARYIDDHPSAWRAYAKRYGYAYHLWTEDDEESLATMMDAPTYAVMQEARQAGKLAFASDIARYVILARLGGIYLDIDIPTPKACGQEVDLREVMPLRGFVVTSEGQAREVGNSGLYMPNAVIMASPEHPIMRQMVRKIAPNHRAWMQRVGSWHIGPFCITGQHYFARQVAGPITIIPYTTIEQLDMHFFGSAAEWSERGRLFAERTARGETGPVAAIHLDAAGKPIATPRP